MRKLLLALLGAFALFASTAMADERPLRPTDRSVTPGETRCLPFFVKTTFGGVTSERIVFSFQVSNGTVKRDAVAKSRTVVQIVINPQPTYEKVVADDGYDGAVFRLSQDEYEKARPCLPEPTKAPPQ
jgi:hypothetical protein